MGIDLATSVAALREFEGVKRRMEHLGTIEGVSVYDDFAHHPTAIDDAQRHGRQNGCGRFGRPPDHYHRAALEYHEAWNSSGDLASATAAADLVLWKKPGNQASTFALLAQSKCPAHAFEFVEEIVCFVEEQRSRRSDCHYE